MKYIIFVLLVFFNSFASKGQYYKDNKWSNYKIDQYYLDYNSFYEMHDSAVKYSDLYLCSWNCSKFDSCYYYKGRAAYFINQSEYYCCLLYGVDSVISKLYYKPGEIRKKIECRCN